MATIKADVTAENKPAYSPKVRQTPRLKQVENRENTHEDQGGIQVSTILLQKIVIILIGLAFELVVELGSDAAAS